MSKTILKKIHSLSAKLEEEIERRNEKYNERSERWQESEKGEVWVEYTDQLQEMFDTTTDWIDFLE